MNFNRRDVGYTIISRFEESFRDFLAHKLATHFPEYKDGVPGGVINKVYDRSSQDTWSEPQDFLENTDFPDLMEITCYNGMYKNYFVDSEIYQAEFQEVMNELYSLRCKIAHVRQNFTSFDLDKLTECTRRIATLLDTFGETFHEFLQEISDHPAQVVIPTPIEFISEIDPRLVGIPNNIPTPDYEYEGGFVGREEDVKKIIGLLEGDLHRVITISGAGGVGKTSLALKVIQQIVQKSRKKFDGIIWLSAKETKLSYVGIEDIEPSIKSYEQLLTTISEVMEFGILDGPIEKKEADIQTLFGLHKCILIVIDNLETISDERIINFILDTHPNTKVLITSRTGLGQVERRYELKQLKEREAIHLFRLIARDKKLNDLVSANDETLRNYVKKVSCYPLAIKWVIGQVAVGKDINRVISAINETTSDISRFCFEQVYNNSLSISAKKILCTLSVVDEAPSTGILSYVLDIDQHALEDGIRELVLVSLAIPEQHKTEQNEIVSRYNLLSLTRGYVRQQLDKDVTLKRDILDRLQTIQNVVEEAERAKRQYRFSLANLGAVTEEEKVAAMIAQTAFQKYQLGRYSEAIEGYKRAITIAPRFASLYRNWAVMEAQERHLVEADELMKKASELNSNDTQIWLAWGNIKRKEDKVKEALQKYEIAYKLSPGDSVVLNALGQARARLGEYEEADHLFKLALEQQQSKESVRDVIINLTSIADNLTRWAKSHEFSKNFEEAKTKLEQALTICQEVMQLDRNDFRSQDLLREVFIRLGTLHKKLGNKQIAITYFDQVVVRQSVKIMRYREVKDTVIAILEMAKLFHSLGEIEQARSVFMPDLHRISLRSHPDLQNEFFALWKNLNNSPRVLKGKITLVNPLRQFVIIELSASGDTYLGHANSFEPKLNKITDSLIGRAVSFTPFETHVGSKTKKEAKTIKFLGN